MSKVLNDNLSIQAGKPVDSRYLNASNAPYADVAAVNSAISVSYRHLGLTVRVGNVEYEYKNGTANGDLVVKTPVSGLSNGSGTIAQAGSVDWGGPITASLTELTAAVDGVGDLYIGGDAGNANKLATVGIESTTLSFLSSDTDVYVAGAGSTSIGDGSGDVYINTASDHDGDLLTRDAALKMLSIAIGTAGQVLMPFGSPLRPAWRTAAVTSFTAATQGVIARNAGGAGVVASIPVSGGLTLGSTLKWGGTLDASTSLAPASGTALVAFSQTVLTIDGANSILNLGGTIPISAIATKTTGTTYFQKDRDNETVAQIQLDTGGLINIFAANGTSINNIGAEMNFRSGDAYSSAGNGQGGAMIFTSGNGHGSGVPGQISFVSGRAIKYNNDVAVDDSGKGLLLKSPNGHYWRLTIDNAGAVTWTDIGTVLP